MSEEQLRSHRFAEDAKEVVDLKVLCCFGYLLWTFVGAVAIAVVVVAVVATAGVAAGIVVHPFFVCACVRLWVDLMLSSWGC